MKESKTLTSVFLERKKSLKKQFLQLLSHSINPDNHLMDMYGNKTDCSGHNASWIYFRSQ